jgi:ribonuclease D
MRRLKKWRAETGAKQGIDTSVIISNKALKVISKEYPADAESLCRLGVISELKCRIYGQQILEALNNKE